MTAAGGSGPPAPTPSGVGAGRAGRREEALVLGEEGRTPRHPRSWPRIGQTPRCEARERQRQAPDRGRAPWPFFSISRPKNPDKRWMAKGQKHSGRQEVVQEAQLFAVGARRKKNRRIFSESKLALNAQHLERRPQPGGAAARV